MILILKGMLRIFINVKYKIKVNESDGKYVIKRLWEFGKVISFFFYIIFLLEKINFKWSKFWFRK